MADAAATAARPEKAQTAFPATVGVFWRRAVSEPRATPAYLVEDGGGWREVSWQAASLRVEEIANGLLAKGVRLGDPVAILGRTGLDWIVVDLALGLIGAVGVPIYPTSSAAEIRYILEHSEAVGLFVDAGARPAESSGGAAWVVTFEQLDDLAADGRAHRSRHPDALERAGAAVTPDDVFTYQYTSGTTGPPKACIVLHRNYVEMTRTAAALSGLVDGDDVVLLFLPLAHNFGRLLYLAGIEIGFTTALLADPMRVRDVLTAIRPTLLPSVPRLFEKLQSVIEAQFAEASGVRGHLIAWALDVGRRTSPYRQRGKPLPPTLAWQHRLADRLVYSRVKERLGGRLRVAVSGGAPLAKEVAEFFHALDILVLEGYGQSECTTACAVNLPDDVRFGTVGRPFPDFEVRTAEDGEILVRGPTVFAGYLKDEVATREALDPDGWLHTGDVGRFDAEGFLVLTDRKKDIIVTAGGKNISPQNLENALKAAPLLSQALVVGDRRSHLAALLTLDEEAARAWARERGIEPDLAALSINPDLRRDVAAAVERVNAGLARYEQVKRFAILPRDFSADEGEVTPTLKLKRRVCEQHFAAEIDSLYPGPRRPGASL